MVNGKKADGKEKLKNGDVITLFLSGDTIEKFRGVSARTAGKTEKTVLPAEWIVYENSEVIALNKPAGILSQKAKASDISLTEYLEDYLSGREDTARSMYRPGLSNRLDRNTSGLVLAGKTVSASQTLGNMIRNREIGKYYLTVVKGILSKENRISGYLRKNDKKNQVTICEEEIPGSTRIETAYQPLAFHNGSTLLKVELVTGKSHQIRSHLASIGHPIAGDPKYGDSDWNRMWKQKYGLSCQLLHSWKMVFPDTDRLPENLSGRTLEAPLPPMFRKISEGEGWKELWN